MATIYRLLLIFLLSSQLLYVYMLFTNQRERKLLQKIVLYVLSFASGGMIILLGLLGGYLADEMLIKVTSYDTLLLGVSGSLVLLSFFRV